MKRFLGVILLLVIIVNFWFGNVVEGVDNKKNEKLDTNKLMQQTSNTLQKNTLTLLKTVKLSTNNPQKVAQLFNSDFKNNLENYLMAVILHAASDPAFHTALDKQLKTFTSKLSNVKTGSGNSSEDMGLIGGSLVLLILLKQMPPITV
tara:strand:+ start:794 stop:1237 length:444 start_codon:yes stop_codon:yes gene_type:complete